MGAGDDFIEAHEATRVRILHEGGGAWAVTAADAAGNQIDSNWNRDGGEDRTLTRERAMELVPEFVAHLGLPAGLPVEVWDCDPVRLIELIASPRFYTEHGDGRLRPATPARVVCYGEGYGEWTIEVQDADGAAIRDERGDYWSVWHDEEALGDYAPMGRDEAIAAAATLAVEIGLPTLPVYISEGEALTLVNGGAA